MTKVYTIARMTGSGRDQGSSWSEPEIGSGVYGKLVNLPPIFKSKAMAIEYGYSLGLFLKTQHPQKQFIVVELELL